jgi:hypothetical protein
MRVSNCLENRVMDEGQVLQSDMSRRVELRFISFVWLVWFVWFEDERDKTDPDTRATVVQSSSFTARREHRLAGAEK